MNFGRKLLQKACWLQVVESWLLLVSCVAPPLFSVFIVLFVIIRHMILLIIVILGSIYLSFDKVYSLCPTAVILRGEKITKKVNSNRGIFCLKVLWMPFELYSCIYAHISICREFEKFGLIRSLRKISLLKDSLITNYKWWS